MPSVKPTAAFILSVAAGIFNLVGGLVVWVAFSTAANPILSALPILGIFGAIMGLAMIIGSMMVYSDPRPHDKWGIVVLVFAFVSWIVALGGLIIGFVLGLVGGILWILWKPRLPAPTVPLIPTDGECPYCGNPLAKSDRSCPRCGKELEFPSF